VSQVGTLLRVAGAAGLGTRHKSPITTGLSPHTLTNSLTKTGLTRSRSVTVVAACLNSPQRSSAGNSRHRQFSGGPAMNLKSGYSVEIPYSTRWTPLIQDYGRLLLPRVRLAVPGGDCLDIERRSAVQTATRKLRHNHSRHSIFTMRPPVQPPPPIIGTEVEPGMELRQRNNERTMITFHSRQSDCARRARKTKNAGMFNFVSQIASPIYTVMHTKRVKTDATSFESRCSRTVMCYRFYRVEAYPLAS